jgi:hypothetical protein
MANQFNKEEIVAFEAVLEGMEDQMVFSDHISIYNPGGTDMERTNDVIWRPMPYIATSQNRVVRSPITPSDMTQLAVPTTLGFAKSVPFTLDAKEMRDQLQEGRLAKSAVQRLSSDINTALFSTAANYGGLVVTRTTAAGTYDDVAVCDAVMNERGVPADERCVVFNTRDYNGMAGNLANRQNLVAGKTQTAYDRSYIGQVAGFDAFKSDTGPRIRAAGITGRTIDTRVSANNFYVPVATTTSVTGQTNNVDNRFQTITVSNNANFQQGDCLSYEGVTAVHAITKQDSGQPFTQRVVSVGAGNTLVVTPPMITGQGGLAAQQYQNCVVAGSGLASAAVTVMNFDAAGYNVFWHKPAVELVVGRYSVPTDQGAAVMSETTKQGLNIVMTKFFDTKTFTTLYTFDTLFGTNVLNPEMVGVLLFNQTP